MNEYVLSRLEHLQILDTNGHVSFGFDQEWYGTAWQRMSGCGPTVASTLLFYLHRSQGIALPVSTDTKADCVKLMEAVWPHVTPTMRGVYQLEQLCGGIQSFAQEHGLALTCYPLNIPKKIKDRPALTKVIRFIADGLASDCPIAFLNLSNGKVKELDEWHWVPIVSLKAQENGATAEVTIYDGGKPIQIDLKLWYETTSWGGGFAYFVDDKNK